MVLSYAWPRWSAVDLASSSLIPLSRQELLNLGLDVSLSELGYRQLVVNWDSTLVVCSFVVSFVGAYSASQVCCQANVSSKSTWHFYAWNGLAGTGLAGQCRLCMLTLVVCPANPAILFGLCSVWSCRLSPRGIRASPRTHADVSTTYSAFSGYAGCPVSCRCFSVTGTYRILGFHCCLIYLDCTSQRFFRFKVLAQAETKDR